MAEPETGRETRRPEDLTWDDVVAALGAKGALDGEWLGYPLPLPGQKLVLYDKHPKAAAIAEHEVKQDAVDRVGSSRAFVCGASDVREDVALRNEWWSDRLRMTVRMYQVGARVEALFDPGPNPIAMALETMSCHRAWSAAAEERATLKLADLVTAHAYRCYLFTGGFIETSRRSGVTYYFRRLRPTLALKQRHPDRGVEVLAALCLHPLGHYQGTWAGAMTPTDDVLAHLVLMRGDERRFWSQANQHQAIEPAAGVVV